MREDHLRKMMEICQELRKSTSIAFTLAKILKSLARIRDMIPGVDSGSHKRSNNKC